MTVSDIALYALENNREIRAAEEDLAEARDTISRVFSFDKSSLTVSGGYNFALGRLFFGRIRDDNSALGLGLFFHALYQNSVV